MYKQGLFRWVLVVVFALSTIGVSGVALAQDSEPEEEDGPALIEIEGEFELQDGDTIVVDGMTIAPAGAFIPSMLEEGDMVRITGYLLNDDTLKAVSLEVLDEEELDDDVDPEDGEAPVDDPELDREDEEEDEDAPGCERDDHPVVLAMVETYGDTLDVTYDDLIALHCEGNGLGNLIKVLEAAQRAGMPDMPEGEEGEGDPLLSEISFDDMWEMYQEAGNFGQFKKMLADEYGIHPSDLAPGQAVGKNKNRSPEEEMEPVGEANDAPGNSGNAPGRSNNNGNGRDRNDDAPGNSGNAPGHSGDAPGNSGNAPGRSGNNGNGKNK